VSTNSLTPDVNGSWLSLSKCEPLDFLLLVYNFIFSWFESNFPSFSKTLLKNRNGVFFTKGHLLSHKNIMNNCIEPARIHQRKSGFMFRHIKVWVLLTDALRALIKDLKREVIDKINVDKVTF